MTPVAYYKGFLKQKLTFLYAALGPVGASQIFSALHL
jgi:hypothetical protein